MQDEKFLRRLSEVLRATDDPSVEPIVAHAREAAVTEATAILEALITRSILERAVDHLSARESGGPRPPRARSDEPAPPHVDSDDEPAPPGAGSGEPARSRDESDDPAAPRVGSGEVLAPRPESGEEPGWVWYVYGIERADAEPPDGVTGIVGATVEGVEADGLRAVVSKVPSTDFEQPALVEHFDDIEWVGANAQAHEAVLGAALAGGPVLPLRFGTVFHDHAAVVDVLRRHADDLQSEVDRMTGRREWGAKVVVDLDACDRWIAEHMPGLREATPDQAAEGGRAYLARRQAQRSRRDERHRLLLDIAGEIHERLSDLAVDAGTAPPQQRELSGHEGEMILNGAYLVDDTAIEAFHEAAGELTERHADKGVVVQVTGPWPPHHFISLPPLGDLAESA